MKRQHSRAARIVMTMGYFLVIAVLLGAAPGVFAEGGGYGPGRIGLKMLAGRDHVEAGIGGIWNSRDKLHVQLDPADGWRIKKVHMWVNVESPPVTTTGNPKIGHFNFKEEYPAPYKKDYDDGHIFRRTLVMDLIEDLSFQWGQPWEYMRTQCVAIHMDLVKLDETGKVTDESGAWVVPELIIHDDPVEEAEAVADEVIADEVTGEVVADADIDTEDDGRGDKQKVAAHEHQKAQKTLEVEELSIDIESF